MCVATWALEIQIFWPEIRYVEASGWSSALVVRASVLRPLLGSVTPKQARVVPAMRGVRKV
jgi:hypothetical protein